MASYVKLAAEAGDKYLSALTEFQENFLKTVSAGAERVKAAKTAAPTPAFDFPIPTASDVADANFAFVQKLVKQQKTFVDKLLATATPATK